MTQGKADKQAGEKLFNALRELEVQFLNGGHSVQTSAQKLLRDHGYTPANQMAKYLIAQSILKKDEQNSTHKKPMYWYNGEKLSVKYCNSLILQMKLDRSASSKPKTIHPESIGLEIGAPFDEKVEVPKKTPPCRPEENPFPIHKDPYGRDEKPTLPPGYVDPWDADEKDKIENSPEFKAGKKAYQEKMREIEHINQARINELDAQVEDLKESLRMRILEIDGVKKTRNSLRDQAAKWVVEAEKYKAENMRLTKKIKKIKKLLKAVL